MKVESIPMQGISDAGTRNALDVLQRNIQAIAGNKGLATKDDIADLKRLINAVDAQGQRTVTSTITAAPREPIAPVDQLPVVSGAYGEIWTLSAAPPSASPSPSSLQIINNSPGATSTVDPVTGSGGNALNFAQINIYGTYVYPAADMNLGFGGFLNFITRNLAGTPIQGAFVNGGLIGTTEHAERGDLDLAIYGPAIGGGNNTPRIIALRAEAGGTLALTVDNDGDWDLGDSVGRWHKGYFSSSVQCGGMDMNFNSAAPWVARLANPSSQISAGPYSTLVGYMTFYWNSTPVHVPCYTT